MSARDLRSRSRAVVGLRARTIATATTTSGAATDSTGWTDCIVIFDAGTITGASTTCDVTITESTTSGGSYSAISGAAFAQVGTSSGGATTYVGHIKLGRSGGPYIKASVVTTGAAVSVPLSITYLFYNKVDSGAGSSNTYSFQVN